MYKYFGTVAICNVCIMYKYKYEVYVYYKATSIQNLLSIHNVYDTFSILY
jgi:hypothetical protein